jgi:hypothetical protein
MPALTRREARDVLRRDKLSLLTSVQEYERFGTGDNVVGDPASSHPDPDNAQINSQLDLAADFLNRKCRIGHVQDVEIEVAAQTADGPLAISLRNVGVGQGGLTPGDINQVKRVYFEESDGTTYRILPRGREEFDQGTAFDHEFAIEFMSRSVGRTRWFWIEGYTLYLLPAPDTAVTLHLIAGTGLLFVADAASLESLPNDYHDVLWNCAAWFLARNLPGDTEMLALAQQYGQMTQDGIGDILQWKRDVSTQQEDTLTPMTDRRTLRRASRSRGNENIGFIPEL